MQGNLKTLRQLSGEIQRGTRANRNELYGCRQVDSATQNFSFLIDKTGAGIPSRLKVMNYILWNCKP